MGWMGSVFRTPALPSALGPASAIFPSIGEDVRLGASAVVVDQLEVARIAFLSFKASRERIAVGMQRPSSLRP